MIRHLSSGSFDVDLPWRASKREKWEKKAKLYNFWGAVKVQKRLENREMKNGEYVNS